MILQDAYMVKQKNIKLDEKQSKIKKEMNIEMSKSSKKSVDLLKKQKEYKMNVFLLQSNMVFKLFF